MDLVLERHPTRTRQRGDWTKVRTNLTARPGLRRTEPAVFWPDRHHVFTGDPEPREPGTGDVVPADHVVRRDHVSGVDPTLLPPTPRRSLRMIVDHLRSCPPEPEQTVTAAL